MELEKQVASLELSKKLKEVGYPQEGVWWWQQWMRRFAFMYGQITLVDIKYIKNNEPMAENFVAPTVAELGERLPKDFVSQFNGNRWSCFYNGLNEDKTSMVIRGCLTEANARAKMWLYLKEKGLV